jgi:hypothetical protein
VAGAAFVPTSSGADFFSLGVWILKELGLEKPSWLTGGTGRRTPKNRMEPTRKKAYPEAFACSLDQPIKNVALSQKIACHSAASSTLSHPRTSAQPV